MTLHADLVNLLARYQSELAYNDAKGTSAYREGMHDGLHFAADALADVLLAHGLSTETQPTIAGSVPREYEV